MKFKIGDRVRPKSMKELIKLDWTAVSPGVIHDMVEAIYKQTEFTLIKGEWPYVLYRDKIFLSDLNSRWWHTDWLVHASSPKRIQPFKRNTNVMKA